MDYSRLRDLLDTIVELDAPHVIADYAVYMLPLDQQEEAMTYVDNYFEKENL